MNKKILIVMAVLILGGIGWYSSFWIRYCFATKKSNEEEKHTICKERTDESFVGRIGKLDRFEYDAYMKDHFVALEIVPDTGNSITYQYYFEDAKDKLSFIETNDRILKNKNSQSFIVIKRNGTRKEFVVPSCE